MNAENEDLAKRQKQAEQDLDHLGIAAPPPKEGGSILAPINIAFDEFRNSRPGLTGDKKSKKKEMLQRIRENITEISSKFIGLKTENASSKPGDENRSLGIEGMGPELKAVKDMLKDLAHAGLPEDQVLAILEQVLDRTEHLKARAGREELEHNFEEYVEGEMHEIKENLRELEEEAEEEQEEFILHVQEGNEEEIEQLESEEDEHSNSSVDKTSKKDKVKVKKEPKQEKAEVKGEESKGPKIERPRPK